MIFAVRAVLWLQGSFFHISFSYKIAAESQIDCKAPVFYNKYRTKENREASEAGHTVEVILLREKIIAPCHACYACMETHSCVIGDDMGEVFQKLLAADVTVLASPVYFYSVSAQMKAMIDRCLADHKSLRNKKFYYIITAADPQREAAEGTLLAFRGFIRCLPGSQALSATLTRLKERVADYETQTELAASTDFSSGE